MTPHRPVALVTGASSGIGRAIAVALSGAGYDLALAARREDALDQTARIAHAASALILPVDLGAPEACADAVARTVSHFSRLDALVNNAGVGTVLPIDQTTPDALEATFRLNTFAAAFTIHYAWPHMVKARRGCIVNISSVASLDPFPGFFAYGASKAAVNLLTLSAAREGAEHNIRAFSIAPGATETPMLRAAFDESFVSSRDTLRPDDVARLVLDCIQGRRDRDNGRTIPILPPAHRPAFEQWARDNPTLTS